MLMAMALDPGMATTVLAPGFGTLTPFRCARVTGALRDLTAQKVRDSFAYLPTSAAVLTVATLSQ